jgi:hypothetical protein
VQLFGDEIWVVISVAEGGALAVTQALFATSLEKGEHMQTVEEQDEDLADMLAASDLRCVFLFCLFIHVKARPEAPMFGSSVFGDGAVCLLLLSRASRPAAFDASTGQSQAVVWIPAEPHIWLVVPGQLFTPFNIH